MRIFMRSLVGMLSFILLFGGVSRAQGLLQTLYPEILSMPAPNWVQDGTRLTYYVASAGTLDDLELFFDDEYGNRYSKEVLLYCGSATTQRRPDYPRIEKPASGGVLTHAQLVTVRDVSLPWSLEAPPAWLLMLQYLQYDGSLAIVSPNMPVFPFPLNQGGTIVERGSDWNRINWVTTLQGSLGMPDQITESVEVTSAYRVGGVWLPPEGLAKLREGQLLDTDSVTGCETRVGFVGSVPDGSNVVGLLEAASSFVCEYYYVADTGMLIATRYKDYTSQDAIYATELRLTGYH